MAKPRSGARTRAGAPPKLDDLTVIEGIGAARSEWLRAELGVQTYADLAAMPVDEVVSGLKAAGQVASAGVAGGWVARARELAEPDWAPLASFVVEFQGHEATGALRTVVHHVEADESETWLGVEAGRASDWMLQRAPEPAAGEAARAGEAPAGEAAAGEAAGTGEAVPPPAGPADRPPAPAPAGARIGPVRLLHDGETDPANPARPPGRAFSHWLRGDEPFAIEVPLELETAGACRVRVYAEDLATARRIHLGDGTPERIDGPRSAYVAVIADCTLPEGMYRLSVLASEPGRPAGAALEAPLLRVG